jgi:outer membrane protein insertion porin family
MKVCRSISICNSNFRLIAAFIILIAISVPGLARSFKIKRQPVASVDITGNRAFTDGKLKSFLYTKSNHWYNLFSKRKVSISNLIYDVQQLERFYARNGFLYTKAAYTAHLVGDDSSWVEVEFDIVEGRKVFAESLAVDGGLPKINRSLGKYLNKIKIGQPVNNEAVQALVLNIKNVYADNAYPLANVVSSYEFPHDSTNALIRITIDPGLYILNGKITIVRDTTGSTRESTIRRELLVKTGQPYDRRKVVESQQRLYSTGLLRFVTLRRTLEIDTVSADTAYNDLRLVIAERRPNFVSFKAGATGQDPDFNALLIASASWGNRNLWGTGRKLILTGSSSAQLTNVRDTLTFKELFSKPRLKLVRNSVDLNYVEPWFLNYRLPLAVTAIYEPRNWNILIDKYYDRWSGELSLSRELNRYTNIRLSARAEFVKIKGLQTNEKELIQNGNLQIRRRLSLYGQRDTRDNILAPQKGSYSYSYVDYVGGIFGGDYSYVKGEFYWSRFNNFSGSNILATRINFGALSEMKANGSNSDDRFTLGGAKSIRGFKENGLGPRWTQADGIDSTSTLFNQPKGGKLMLMANIELRRPLFWRFGGTAFVDVGNVFYDIEDFRPDKLEITPGLGLQFFTPIGPIRLDRAVVAQKQFDLEAGAWHLTILYAF